MRNPNQTHPEKPVYYFESEEELKAFGQYYQYLLGLEGWVIQYKLDLSDIGGREENVGSVSFKYLLKIAEITVSRRSEEAQRNYLIRQPEECTLLHELIHIFLWQGACIDERTTEGSMAEMILHQQVEMLSRAILMAKYNLLPLYFNRTLEETACLTKNAS